MLKYIYERKPELLDKMIKKCISTSVSEILGSVIIMENSNYTEPKYAVI